MLRVFAAAAFVPLAALADPAAVAGLPAQTFTLDPSHSSVTFSLSHLGFSSYTAGFDTVAGTLDLDPAAPGAARVTVTIGTDSLDLPSPPEGFAEMMLGPDWFDAAAHPRITFVSDAVRQTGPQTADIDGTLTIRGIAQPVTLSARLNGGWSGEPWEPWARIGFSATAEVSRTAFGMGFGVPTPEMPFGVGDAVAIRIETEWTGERVR
jgi:polyisoprenoid-binding protein YceI